MLRIDENNRVLLGDYTPLYIFESFIIFTIFFTSRVISIIENIFNSVAGSNLHYESKNKKDSVRMEASNPNVSFSWTAQVC
jgi:hypothetical protein